MELSEILRMLILDKYFLSAFSIAIITLIIIFLIHFARKYIHNRLKRNWIVSPKQLLRFETPIILVGVVLAADIVLNKILSEATSITQTVQHINSTLLIVAFTFLLSIFSDIMIHNWSSKLNKERGHAAHEEIVPLFKSVKNILLGILALLLILQAWGVQITGIAASIGVIGVIIGFVYKDTLSNIFSGISMIMDNSFKKGDLIELQDGELGYVQEINLRSTKMKNFNSEEVIIPNSKIANMQIKNYAHPSKTLRLKISFSVEYGTNPEKVKKVILGLLHKLPAVSKFPKPKIYFDEMSEYSLKFTALFFIKDYNKMFQIKSNVTTSIYGELRKNKIKIPFPTRTIIRKN